jgi:hypothetical protein
MLNIVNSSSILFIHTFWFIFFTNLLNEIVKINFNSQYY